MRSGRQEYDVMCLASNNLPTASSKFKTHVIPRSLAPIPQSLFIGTLYLKEGGKVSSHRWVGLSYSCLPLLIQF